MFRNVEFKPKFNLIRRKESKWSGEGDGDITLHRQEILCQRRIQREIRL